MKHLVISCSLNPVSRSRILARAAFETLKKLKVDVEFIDLTDYKLPVCDGDSVYGDKNVKILQEKISKANGIILATPVYNYNASASAKNLVELTGDAWEDKVVGFLCAAGGNKGYMAVMGLANSLMLDFRCVIIPKFVYASRDAFGGEGIVDPSVKERIEELAEIFKKFTAALK